MKREKTKVIKKISRYDVLQRIPLSPGEPPDEPYSTTSDYRDCVEAYIYTFDRFKENCTKGNIKCSFIGAVNSEFEYGWCGLDENGLDKFTAMMAGLLYEMEHDEIEYGHAYATAWDILDFETGNYDDLLAEEDLKDIRDDIEKIREYCKKDKKMAAEFENALKDRTEFYKEYNSGNIEPSKKHYCPIYKKKISYEVCHEIVNCIDGRMREEAITEVEFKSTKENKRICSACDFSDLSFLEQK